MATMKEIRGDIPVTINLPYMTANTTGGTSWTVPYDYVLTSAKLIPSAAITANGSNYFTVSVFNRGAAGAGTTQPVVARSYAATNSVRATPETLTLSSTASDLNLTANDVINVEVAPTGTGLIWPGGSLQLTVRRR